MDTKSFFYENFASQFDDTMNRYDLETRIRIIFNHFFTDSDLKDKLILDAGCGTGWFSKAAAAAGARVVSMDLGINLLQQVKNKVSSSFVAGSILNLPFQDSTFDCLINTEVIEHLPSNPAQAVREFHRVLKPNGKLVLTTPNKAWHFAIDIANLLHLRPYQGYENWLSWNELQQMTVAAGFTLTEIRGFHAFPFVFKWTYPILAYLDRYGSSSLGPWMLNTGLSARKK